MSKQILKKGPSPGGPISCKSCLLAVPPIPVCHSLLPAEFGVGSCVLQLEPPDTVLQGILGWTKGSDGASPAPWKEAGQGTDRAQTCVGVY